MLWLASYLPGDVGLPAPPSLTEMLQDGARLVLLDALWHHVQDVMHDSRSQLQVKVRLYALLGYLHKQHCLQPCKRKEMYPEGCVPSVTICPMRLEASQDKHLPTNAYRPGESAVL